MKDFKSDQDRIDFIGRQANKGIAKAIKENSAKGLPNVFVIDGKRIYKMPDGRVRNTSPFKNEDR